MNEESIILTKNAIGLLEKLITIPSPSGNEAKTAAVLKKFLSSHGIKAKQKHNNLLVKNDGFDPEKPTILLNSHHDTVKPGQGWQTDPYESVREDDILYGLGSNDAGASLVSLIAVFMYFNRMSELNYNLILLITAEEENTGAHGMSAMVEDIKMSDFAIVGEPTGMELAVAEKGLIVLECTARGKTGHAARDIGNNAIYSALKDMAWFESYKFSRESDVLGAVKMTVTMVEAGIQHNVIPDKCKFTVDIRSTDVYTHEEILETISKNIKSEITRSSLWLNPSSIERNHTLVNAARAVGIPLFGSPTLSDQALLPMPSVKIGPGRSERSHTPNEFIHLSEIEQGINIYIDLLGRLL